MVPETYERLKNAYEDLKNKLDDADENIKTTPNIIFLIQIKFYCEITFFKLYIL